MLPHTTGDDPTRLFGFYNTVATLGGSLGALLAYAAASSHWAARLSGRCRAGPCCHPRALGCSSGAKTSAPSRCRPCTARVGSSPALALFALDSHGGSFVPQAFVAYLFHPQVRRLAADARAVVFAIGLLQAVSFQGAVRLAGRIGLLRTMVFTHLPSNVLPAGVAFAPDLTTAIALLLARFLLSQADPTREAYVVIAGPPKSVYDIGLCTLFRRVPLHTAAA